MMARRVDCWVVQDRETGGADLEVWCYSSEASV